MTDLLNGWFVDSSPGGGAKLIEKCGNLKAASGLAGVSSITTDTPEYDTDEGDRAMITPGTHPTLNTGHTSGANAARGLSMGFSSEGTVLFDGYAMMYALTRPTDRPDCDMTISFWISPDGPSQGAILASPFQEGPDTRLWDYHDTTPSSGPGPNWNFFYYVSFSPFVGESDAGSKSDLPEGVPWLFQNQTKPNGSYTGAIPGGIGSVGNNILQHTSGTFTQTVAGSPYTNASTTFASNAGAYIAGTDGVYFHVMISVKHSGGNQFFTLAVNDDVIMNNVQIYDNTGTNSDSGDTFAMPWTSVLADGFTGSTSEDDYIQEPNVLHIGGRNLDFVNNYSGGWTYDLDCRPEGEGLLGAVTEVWIDLTRALDWTDENVRKKFHTTDILEEVYVPVNLGKNGATPTGSRPTMYFTGNPNKFIINRVNGHVSSVYKGTTNSLTLDGRYPGAL